MREIYTAQYRYSGDNRFDITVKGNDRFGRYFAPTWSMVMSVKKKEISEEEYEKLYKSMTIKVLKDTRLMKTLGECFPEKIVLVCFCKKNSFCHRYILARMMEEEGFGKYIGEVGGNE
jgi:hypothetical protein